MILLYKWLAVKNCRYSTYELCFSYQQNPRPAVKLRPRTAAAGMTQLEADKNLNLINNNNNSNTETREEERKQEKTSKRRSYHPQDFLSKVKPSIKSIQGLFQ